MGMSGVEIGIAILAALGGAGAVIGAVERVRDWRAGKRQANANATATENTAAGQLSDTVLELLAPFREQVGHLKRELGEAREEIRLTRVEAQALAGYIDVLILALRDAQVPVPPRP